MGRQGRGVTAAALAGDRDVDAAPVKVAEAALDQAVLLEPADQPRQRALAQVYGIGELLDPELVVRALGKALEHLEVADAQTMPLAKLPVQRARDDGMVCRECAPGCHIRLHRGIHRRPARPWLCCAHTRRVALIGIRCKRIKCTCI